MIIDLIMYLSHKINQHFCCYHEFKYIDPSLKVANCSPFYVCKKCDYVSKFK